MQKSLGMRLVGLTKSQPHETKAVLLAFTCNFVLLGSYYILRPLRDAMGTVFGVSALQDLFTGTFVLTLVCSPLFAWCAATIRLKRFIPGLFWFLLADLLIFYVLFQHAPGNRWLAGAYYCWFSVINLFLISIFWTFMADTFSPDQATRLFAFIAAGGSAGAIFGPLITRFLVGPLGVGGLLLVAGGGFLLVIVLVHLLIAEKKVLQVLDTDTQRTTLDHKLPGNPFRGFSLLFRSRYLMGQAVFFLLMTWIATILYFFQADYIAKAYSAVESRTVAFADIDLIVNVGSVLFLVFGLSRFLRRFGVTAGLALTPVLMAGAFVALALAPTFAMVQATRVLQRITQYAVARPSREVLFTVVDQESRYKAKNVIDTSVYRFGDLTAAWAQAGLRAAGFGFATVLSLAVGLSLAWTGVAVLVGRRYESLAAKRAP